MSLKTHNDITINSRHNNKKMLTDARYIPDNKKKPVVVFVHGFKGFKDWGPWNLVGDNFAQAGFTFVKFNLSHNGTTPEHPIDFADLEAFSENNYSIELDDIGTVIDYLFSKDCDIPASEMDLNNLFLLGHSRGGGLALLKASADARVKAVTTWAAVADLKRWTSEEVNEWKEKGVVYIFNGRTQQQMPMKYQMVEDFENNADKLNLLKAVKTLSKPLLIVHGTDDETVSTADARKIHAVAPESKLLLLEGANHVFGASHPYNSPRLPEEAGKAVNHTINFFESFTNQ